MNARLFNQRSNCLPEPKNYTKSPRKENNTEENILKKIRVMASLGCSLPPGAESKKVPTNISPSHISFPCGRSQVIAAQSPCKAPHRIASPDHN